MDEELDRAPATPDGALVGGHDPPSRAPTPATATSRACSSTSRRDGMVASRSSNIGFTRPSSAAPVAKLSLESCSTADESDK